METFGEWLQGQLNEKGWSARYFAHKRLGVSHTTVGHWLKDEREPSRDDLKKIATGLDVPVATVGLAFLGLLPEQTTTPALPAEIPMIHAIGDLVDRLDASYRAAILEWLQAHYGFDVAAHARDTLGRARRQA